MFGINKRQEIKKNAIFWFLIIEKHQVLESTKKSLAFGGKESMKGPGFGCDETTKVQRSTGFGIQLEEERGWSWRFVVIDLKNKSLIKQWNFYKSLKVFWPINFIRNLKPPQPSDLEG